MTGRSRKTTCAIIGAGGMARHHLRSILPHFADTAFPYICETSREQARLTMDLFSEHKRVPPENIPELPRLLEEHAGALDTVFIITPHALHHDQAAACMEAGLDVLLEKPMVMTADEAKSLIEIRSRTGRLLVVGFQGSLSPQVRHAAALLRRGELGRIQNISATIWQNWNELSGGTWRVRPELSGGGFLFDSGAHLLNTVSDLAGENFSTVAAWFDKGEFEVEVRAAVIGKLRSGAMVTFNACGTTIPTCESEILVFCTRGIIRTGAWGEKLEIQRHGESEFADEPVPQSLSVWQQFLAVRAGEIENPGPPEIGLRMAYLWDAIRASAAAGGELIRIQ